MGWLATLFGSQTGSNKRSMALSSTRDAFSMPSPIDPHDMYGTETPEPESSASYTYPPQANGSSYGYVPTSGTSRSQPGAILPLHNSQRSSMLPYPSLEQTWNRLRAWLSNEYPELGDTLNYGILPQDLAQIEMQFGFALPQAVRDSYLAVDGQEPESSAGCSDGLFFGLHLLPLEAVYDEWRFWREVDSDPTTGGHTRLRNAMQSIPPGWVRREYSNRGWIPLVTDKAGNYIGIDVNPDEAGSIGQVIVFGREFDTKVVLHRGEGPGGWARWLASFVEDLENGEGFEIGQSSDSEGSEDDIGYESYHTGGGDGNGEGRQNIRLVGEYRGWPPLEAWADKSMRKWIEAGLGPDAEAAHSPDKGKGLEKVGLGVLDIAKTAADTGAAEVVIPVFAESELQELKPAAEPSELAGADDVGRSLPTISVTKPPVPRPVLLPSEDDILSPGGFDNPTPADIESGLAMGMSQYTDSNSSAPLSQTTPTSATSMTDQSPTMHQSAISSPLPASQTSPTSTHATASAPVPDLLTDILLDPPSESSGVASLMDEVSAEEVPSSTVRLVEQSGESGATQRSEGSKGGSVPDGGDAVTEPSS